GFEVAVSIAEHEDKKVFPEDWGSRKQDSRNWNQDSSKKTINMEDTSSKAIDGSGIEFNKSEFNLANYKRGLTSVKEQLIRDKSRKGLGFVSYNAVPPPAVPHPPTGLFSPPNLNLSNSGLEEFQQPEFEGYGPKTSKNVSEDTFNEVKESPDE
ncbi:hypothetical protein Tco_1574776, partial [Tanacetum coccineum]